MSRMLLVSMLVMVATLLAASAPALAGGEFELRVLDRPAVTPPTGAVITARPAVVSPAASRLPAQDMSIFDEFGVFQAPRVR